MTLLPGTNYMSNSARTDAEMQVALDKVNEVIAEIGSKDVTTLTIGASVANGITTPLSSMVSIASEGGTGVADTLATIGVSNIDKGRMVILQHANSAEDESTGITITHGTGAGAIEMKDSMSFILCSKRMLGLIYTGATGHWQEVWRGYGRSTAEEKLAERTDIGLGDASVETIATGGDTASKVLKVSSASLITNDVLKINAAGQIEKALVADLGGGNAATLETHNAASFVRTNESSAQSIDADLTVVSANANLIADGTTTAALRLKASGGANERAFVAMDTTNGEMVMGTQTAAGEGTPSIRLNPGGAADEKLEYAVDGSTWQSLTPGPGNGLNADLLDGHEWSDVHTISTSRTLRFNNVQQNTLADTSGGGSVITKFSDMPYPVTPNGVRRFLVSGRLIFHCVAADGFDSDRTVDTKFYSSTDTAAGLNGFIPGTNIETPTGVPDTYYIIQIPPRFYVPGVGESVTVRCGEFGDSQKMDLMTDIGYGAFSDSSSYVQINTTSAASRGRCWVKIEYCDR
jgi:hypothetical protein